LFLISFSGAFPSGSGHPLQVLISLRSIPGFSLLSLTWAVTQKRTALRIKADTGPALKACARMSRKPGRRQRPDQKIMPLEQFYRIRKIPQTLRDATASLKQTYKLDYTGVVPLHLK